MVPAVVALAAKCLWLIEGLVMHLAKQWVAPGWCYRFVHMRGGDAHSRRSRSIRNQKTGEGFRLPLSHW